MSRLCLVGVGLPAFLPSPRHAGPGLRCAHFATSLARAGHELLVVYVVDDGGDPRGQAFEVMLEGRPVRCVGLTEAEIEGTSGRAIVAEFAADAFVGVTTAGVRSAAAIVGDEPLWADVFGDPMAEAQAKAFVHGNDFAVARFWSSFLPALLRGDHYSAVSRAQADALVGQLGLAGRLGAATAGEELVSVIPCAAETRPLAGSAGSENATCVGAGSAAAPDQQLRGAVVPHDAFVVLWSGSFNTWCDVDTTFTGLEEAMTADATVHLVATGGAVRGHDELTYERFRRLVDGSRHVDRFHLLGWVDAERLVECYRDADVGLNVERPLYERRLGSENRVAQWLAHGLPAISTALSDLGRELVDADLCLQIPPGDPAALGRAVVEAASRRQRLPGLREKCRRYALTNLGYDRCAAPLLAWAEQPRLAGDRATERPIEIGLVSEPKAMVRLLEGYLADLGLGQVAYRSVRWLLRRLLNGRAVRR